MINSMAGRDTTGEMLLVTAPRFYLVGLFTGGYASIGSTPGYVPSLLWSFPTMSFIATSLLHAVAVTVRPRKNWSSSPKELEFVAERTGVRCRTNGNMFPMVFQNDGQRLQRQSAIFAIGEEGHLFDALQG